MDVPAKRPPPTGPLPLPVQKSPPHTVASAGSDEKEAAHKNLQTAGARPKHVKSPDLSPSTSETLAPYAPLMGAPADKTKVSSLPGGAALVEKLGAEVAEASYLTPHNEPGRVFRLGKTVANGSFSKIRDYIDQDGKVGKMRVLHLQVQRAQEPKRFMQVTPLGVYFAEYVAMQKAASPLASERSYSVVTGSGKDARVKLYTPVPDLGIDAFYVAYNDLTRQADVRPAAAAIRSFVRGVNDTLLRLHPDDAFGDGMAHRDIKLENVLFNGAGTVSLIDFGSAASLRQMRRTREVAGTIGYLAPEYLAGLDRGSNGGLWPVTAKIDVWSLAVTTLLTFYSDNSFLLPQQTLLQDGNYRASENLNMGLLQEAWQRRREDQYLSEPHIDELYRTYPPHMSGDELSSYAETAIAAIERVQADIERVDPAMAKWFFQSFYRTDPRKRFDSAQLARALDALPPVYDTHEVDRAVARDVFAHLHPLGVANARASLEQVDDGRPGPTVAQLAALPPLPKV